MTEITYKVSGKPAESLVIPTEQPVTILVHQQGIRVDVPTADLILDSRIVLNFLDTLNERDWQHASTSEVFPFLFKQVFTSEEEVPIPKTLQDLKEGDLGVQWISGMIIMVVEAMFRAADTKTPLKIFIREIESHLHPKTQRTVMNLLHTLTNGNCTTE